MFPFHYSSLNYELAKSTPSGSLNILWNQLAEKSKAGSLSFMTPTFDFSIGYEYPEFGTFGNNLLNPMLAIQQTMQSFQNGNWMSGMGGFPSFNGFGNNWMGGMGFPSFNGFGNNWTFPWAGSNTTPSGTSGNSEYNALRTLIQKYKEIGTKNNSISPTLLDKINNALNKSGKQEEKLQALKDLYNDLNKDKLEKALLELPEYKNVLKTAGYKFNGTNKDEDTKLKKEINTLEQDLKNKKGDQLKKFAVSDNNPNILRLISYWNDTHKTDADRGIIRMVASHLPSVESELTLMKDGVNNIAMSLINKVEDFKAEMSGDFSKLDDAKENVSEALKKVSEKFNKENLLKLAKETDTLYAMLRIMEAEKIKNTIKTKYSFLNNISSTDKDIADDKVVVEDTKADLRAEGITTMPSTDVVPTEKAEEYTDIDERCETAEEKVEELVMDGKLKATDKEGVYKSTSNFSIEPAKFYRVKDEQLVELKDVKAIDKSGNCTMKDGSKKALKDVKAVEATAQDVVDYNNTLSEVASLVKEKKLYVTDTSKMNMPKSEKLYYSKGLKVNGKHQFFMIRNNKLMELNCEYVSATGWVVFADGTKKHITKVTDSDFVEASDVKTTDERKEALEAKKEEEQAAKTEEKEALKNKYSKNLELKDVDTESSDYKMGLEISKDLVGYTTDSEWRKVKNNVLNRITSENVYTVLKAYTDDDDLFGSDNILEQIATEGGRTDEEKKSLINHIIKCVLEYCDENGSCASESFKELDKYRKGITKQILDSPNDKLRELDHLILDIFSIDNY